MSARLVIDWAHLIRQKDWSIKTFGPDYSPAAIVAHARKELVEIENDPQDLEEWIDLIRLGFDGALRTGANPAQILVAMKDKQEVCEAREWPDWRTVPVGEPIEHVRSRPRE